MYNYGICLTPGLSEVSSTLAVLTFFLFFGTVVSNRWRVQTSREGTAKVAESSRSLTWSDRPMVGADRFLWSRRSSTVEPADLATKGLHYRTAGPCESPPAFRMSLGLDWGAKAGQRQISKRSQEIRA